MNEQGKLVGILFYSDEPVKAKVVANSFGIDSQKLSNLVSDTNKNLQKLGLFIIENEGELQLTMLGEYTEMIEEFYQVSPQSLSQPSLEVLSIIAYKQPIGKNAIDEIRGVASDQSLKNLLNKGLIKKVSSKHDIKYVTTTEFLKAVGIKSLKDLDGTETT